MLLWLLLRHCGTPLSRRSLMGIGWHLPESSAAAWFTVQGVNAKRYNINSGCFNPVCPGMKGGQNTAVRKNLPAPACFALLCTWHYCKAPPCPHLPGVMLRGSHVPGDILKSNLGACLCPARPKPVVWVTHSCLLLHVPGLEKPEGMGAELHQERPGTHSPAHHTSLGWSGLPSRTSARQWGCSCHVPHRPIPAAFINGESLKHELILLSTLLSHKLVFNCLNKENGGWTL